MTMRVAPEVTVRAAKPRTRWSASTGGEVRAAQVVDVDGESWVVALAGTVLQAADPSGRRRWWLPTRPVSRLLAAGDLTGTGQPSILVRGTQRELAILDAHTGRTLWTWSSPEGTFVNDAGAVLLVPAGRGHRLFVAPIYGTSIEAFDLTGPDRIRHAWTLEGDWDAGFGPSLIAADMDGTGDPRIVLSSRRGDVDRTRLGRHTSAETVLGRRHGLLYQAVVDAAVGAVVREVAWAPNPRGHRCARPYGLLTAVPFARGERSGIVMASCQVEEYLAVTRQLPDGTLERAWSRFVEKDWPTDRQELRVHPDSVRDLRGDGRPELVSSLWDGRRWRTSVRELASGRDRAGDRLEHRVLWGCLAMEGGRSCLVVGESRQRSVGGPTTLELVDGDTLELIDRRRASEVVVGVDRPPLHVAFMAERRGVARLRTGETEAAVIRDRHGSLHAWWFDSATGAATVPIGGSRDMSVSAGTDWALVADMAGHVRGVGAPFGPGAGGAVMRTQGRVAAVVGACDAQGGVVGVELPGPRVRLVGAGPRHGRTGRARSGRQLAMRIGGDDRVLSLAFTRDVRGETRLHLHAPDGHVTNVALGAPLDRPVHWMADGSMVLTLRTGTHTLMTELREPDGRLRWRLDAGAYLHGPASAMLADGPLIVLDDHGLLHAVDGMAVAPMDGVPRPVVRWRRDWTAAYSQPILGPFLPDGGMAIVRANGIHGMELLDLRGRRRWRIEAPLWRYATGEAVVARRGDGWVLVAGRRDGRLDGIDLRDGRVAWSLPLMDALDDIALAAVDLDADGQHEVLVGLPDGRLLALDGLEDLPSPRWASQMDAGVAAIVPLPVRSQTSHRSVAAVIATADGRVRLVGLPTRLRSARPSRGTTTNRAPESANRALESARRTPDTAHPEDARDQVDRGS